MMKFSAIPKIRKSVYVDASAQVMGNVQIKDSSSVWPGCVLRADLAPITIGKFSNIQDLSVIHVETGRGTWVGNYVTVGHGVILHACTVKDECLIGMGSIVLDGAVIERHVLLGAGSLVPKDMKLKSGYLYLGRPAKLIRRLTAKETRDFKAHALRYQKYAARHALGGCQRFSQSETFQMRKKGRSV